MRKTFELCDSCGQETEITEKGGHCEHCGKFLLPCSLCDMDKVKCSECELEKEKRKEYLKDKFIKSFILDIVIKDIMNLVDEDKLMEYIKKEFKDIDLDELRDDIFGDLDDEQFIVYMNEIGFKIKDMNDYNRQLDLQGRDLEEELCYYEDIVYEYEVKGRRELEEYQWALGKIAEIRSLIAENQE